MAKLISFETGPRVVPGNKDVADAFIMPGVNDVDPKLMALYKGHKVIEYLLSKGEDGGLVFEPETPLHTLAGIKSVKEAAELVKDTFNLDLLKQWAEAETRPGVLKAIEQKLKDLTSPDKKPGGEGEVKES